MALSHGNTKYSAVMVEQICDLIKQDTFTISEICELVGISDQSYYEWIRTKSEFALEVEKARQKSKECFAVLAKNSLRKLLEGYEADEIRTEEKRVKNPETGQWEDKVYTTKTKKIFKPDTVAVIFTLTNVDPDNWKNRQHQQVEVENKDALTFEDLQTGMHNLEDGELKQLIKLGAKIKGLSE
jgi:hypothetical protein